MPDINFLKPPYTTITVENNFLCLALNSVAFLRYLPEIPSRRTETPAVRENGNSRRAQGGYNSDRKFKGIGTWSYSSSDKVYASKGIWATI